MSSYDMIAYSPDVLNIPVTGVPNSRRTVIQEKPNIVEQVEVKRYMSYFV